MALRPPPSGIAPAIKALLPHRRKRDKTAPSIARALTVGFVGALWAILNVIAYAGLVFSGPLTPALLLATSAMLGGYAVVALVIALGSRVPGMVTTALSSSAVVYAAAVSGLDQQLVRTGLDDTMARAGLALLLCGWTTVIGGVALWLVGALRAGAAARLLPFPVIEGYHAGLIFSGPLTPALLTATSAMLGGYAVVALVIALGSRVPGMVTTALSSSAVVY
ncbi:MAG: hypothetical protein JOY66_03385, partial [Acetobacteraceae bacterium]|nr:hypothetical protein [Acetobacteraceae bacterium]